MMKQRGLQAYLATWKLRLRAFLRIQKNKNENYEKLINLELYPDKYTFKYLPNKMREPRAWKEK